MDYRQLYADHARNDTPPKTRVIRRKVQQQTTTTLQGMQQAFAGAKQTRADLNYRAGIPSNYRNVPQNLGGTADAHYFNPIEFWNIREYVRAWDRDTPILGQAVDRGLDQILGTGFRVDPQTGDEELNAKLLEAWREWSEDPDQCDITGRMTLDEIEWLALRHMWIDGDCFVVMDDADGAIILHEGDRVDSNSAERIFPLTTAGQAPSGNEIVHGVELSDKGKPVAYHFIKLRKGERQLVRRIFPSVTSPDVQRVSADYVIHLFAPKRVTQSRGVSAFAPVFDRISMHEDIEFAQLVQQQVAACVSAFITSDYMPQWGSQDSDTAADGSTTLNFEEFQPGMIVRLNPGDSVSSFSPGNPTGDAREQAKQIVREIGLAIGLPLELSLLITSDTTFHGYRGVLEAYKRTARRVQQWFSRRFRSRIYKWKVQQWIDEGRFEASDEIFKHVVHFPAWQYVDPAAETKSDAMRIEKHLASPRQIWAERGRDYDQGVTEMVEDRAALIAAAQAAAETLGDDITWRDVLGGDDAKAAPNNAFGDNPDEDPTGGGESGGGGKGGGESGGGSSAGSKEPGFGRRADPRKRHDRGEKISDTRSRGR